MNIPLFKIHWDESDVERVASVIRRGMHWAIGPEIPDFEKKVRDYLGVEYAVAVNSGTSALHAVLEAHGIGQGDEVIVPSFTFIATANAPLFVGATPVFAEVEEDTYGLDPGDVEKKITPRTRAILPVHYGGSPCRIRELAQIARRHDLILIEDAAESIGAMVDGQKVGTFGDSAILSFCANKVISTGEGGMVVTSSSGCFEKVKLVCSHGRLETTDYFSSVNRMEYVTLGHNFRMSTMTAALGIAQIEKIDEAIQMRRANASYLNDKLSRMEGVDVPRPPDHLFHVYQLYTIRLKGNGALRNKLKQHLVNKGIMAKVYFDPVHLTRFYRERFGCQEGLLPHTEKLASEVLTLPMFPGLSRQELDYIVESVAEFMSRGV